MASTTTSSRYVALFLLALFHASSCWDSSNIWFPDTNNPVFYNMTFYQQAGQVVDTDPPSENLIPATEAPPRKTSWQRPRPSVFNPVEEAPVRPTGFEAQRPRPNVFNPVEEVPVRPTGFEAQRPRPNVFNPVEEAPVRPAGAPRPRPSIYRPVNVEQPVRPNVFNPVEETPVRQTGFEAQRPRPNVFNPVEEAPVRPTGSPRPRPSVFRPVNVEQPVRPNVFNPVEETPVRQTNFEAQRPRPNVFNPVEEAPVRPTDFEAQRPRPNVFRPVVAEPPVRPTETYASVVGRRTRPTTPNPERVQPNQNRQPNRQGVKGGSSQSGNRRITEEQQNRNQQNRQPIQNQDSFPDVAVGYKTFPLTEETPVMNNNRRNQQPSRNRLRRTEYEGVAGGTNNFGNGHERTQRQYPEQQRWTGNGDAFLSGSRPEERLETTNNGIGSERNFGRTVVPVTGNNRNWKAGTTDRDPINPVEENVITELETASKPSGPSKCVWAIISCCKPTSSEIRYRCFETLGCHGAFWDTNPCSREMTLAAVQATANFYNVPRTQQEEEED